MCIGIPLRVCAIESGHAWCERRGDRRRVRTALVGDVAVGDWLLVFLDNAQERIAPERAAEIDAVLSLLQEALDGVPLDAADSAHTAFTLPSRMTNDDVRALAGAPTTESLP